jgi:hypothetical protein
VGLGLFLGAFFLGGNDSDPSSEITQIIEKKENPEVDENEENAEEVAEIECAEEEKDEEGNCPVGPKKFLNWYLRKSSLQLHIMNFQEILQQI